MRHALSAVINEILFLLLYRYMQRTKKKKEKADGIFIMRFSHIGDFVLWLDAAKQFRQIYPGEKITFICDRYKDVRMLAERTGYFDEVIVLPTRGIGRLFGIWQAGKLRCRLLIHADPSRTVLADLYVMAVKARERAAQKTDCTRMTKRQAERSDRIYDRVVSCGGFRTMELIRNAQFIRQLSGRRDFRASLPQIPLLIPEYKVRNYLDMHLGVQHPQTYFVLCPGGETPQKYWDAKKFAAVLDDISAHDSRMPCIVLGTQGEEEILTRIRRHMKTQGQIVSLIGKTSLAEYIEIIRYAQWLLSNDTSAAHIAAAAQTQAVVIAQSWDWGRFYPYRTERKAGQSCFPVSVHAKVPCAGCAKQGIRPGHWRCLTQGRVRCIDEIQVNQVIPEVRRIMKNQSPHTAENEKKSE